MRGKFEIEKVLHEIIRDFPKAQEIERKYTQGYITADSALTEIARIFRTEIEAHYE